jgi:hypothetical protein
MRMRLRGVESGQLTLTLTSTRAQEQERTGS